MKVVNTKVGDRHRITVMEEVGDHITPGVPFHVHDVPDGFSYYNVTVMRGRGVRVPVSERFSRLYMFDCEAELATQLDTEPDTLIRDKNTIMKVEEHNQSRKRNEPRYVPGKPNYPY